MKLLNIQLPMYLVAKASQKKAKFSYKRSGRKLRETSRLSDSLLQRQQQMKNNLKMIFNYLFNTNTFPRVYTCSIFKQKVAFRCFLLRPVSSVLNQDAWV